MITIEEIKAQCREAIALASDPNLWDSPWQSDGTDVASGKDWFDACDIANARHITHSRTFSPAAARVMLDTIEMIEAHTVFDHKTSTQKPSAFAAMLIERICHKWEGNQ